MNALQVAERSAVYALQAAVAPAAVDTFDLLASAPQGVAKLRELILSLAVRGKLLQQDHRDEPASKSLARITTAMDRLVADGVIKQHKSAGPIGKADTLFELPARWAWARLADLVAILNGRAYAKDELLSSGVPVLRVGNLFTSNHWYYSNLTLEPEKYCVVGDLLFAWSASFGPFIWSGPKAIYHYHIWKLNLHSAKDLNKNYLYTFLLKKTQEIKAAGHGVSMLHMTKEKMEKIVVPLPPLAEQARIVTRVEELMGLCDELEAHGRLQDEQHARLVATLFDALVASESPQELAENWRRVARHFDLLLDRPEAVDDLEQTILQLAVRGLFVPQDPADESASALLARIRTEKAKLVKAGELKPAKEWQPVAAADLAFSVPKSWIWVRFAEVVNRSEAGWSPRCDDGPRRNGAWGVLKVSAVSWGEFRSHENKQLPSNLAARAKYEVREGDFLISRANTAELVARSVVAKSPEPRLMLSDKLIRLEISAFANRHFVNLVNNAQFARAYYAENASGTSGSMKNVSRQVILNLPIPLPPLAEQHRIVARVDELRGLCADLRQHLQQAQATRQTLRMPWYARSCRIEL